jgi:glycosyltransferase involved in cell wall biosynthesis
MNHPLNIFIPHCSGCLTDVFPHGDGVVAHGFITHLAERGHRLYVASERSELSRSLHANVRLFSIESNSSFGTVNRLSYMARVRALLSHLRKEVRLDLIHQLNPVYTGVTLGLVGSRIPTVLGPYVADWPHDPHGIASSRPALRAVLRRAKQSVAFVQQLCADAILLTTEGARQRVMVSDVLRPTVHILPHGIDSDFFSPEVPTSISATQRRPVILFYANVSERKGIFELLNGFDLLSSEFSFAELWIAGDGEELNAARELASCLSACARIRFLGRQSREQAVLLMRQADIYCLPSHGEPYGMTVVEAMSCGLPVVVTDAGGVRYLVDNTSGLRVPVNSPASIAGAIATLLADPTLRREMGHRNRQKVLQYFSWNKVIDRLEQIYQETLERAHGSQVALNTQSAHLAESLSSGGEPR